MQKIVGISKVSDYDMRKKVEAMSDKERESLIQKLWVTHNMFNNWLEGKNKLPSKKRNQLRHLLGV